VVVAKAVAAKLAVAVATNTSAASPRALPVDEMVMLKLHCFSGGKQACQWAEISSR
jgi:hypothetical protein